MTTTKTIGVGEIHCDSCENAIRTGLSRLDGVSRVQASQQTNQVRVVFDKAAVSESDIRSALAGLGYEPVG